MPSLMQGVSNQLRFQMASALTAIVQMPLTIFDYPVSYRFKNLPKKARSKRHTS
jgi:hypothetical protein